MKENYEINASTLAVIAVDKKRCKIIEESCEFFLPKPAFEIISNSCKFFGSSYMGRFEGTKYLTGISYKAPIIIEESKNMIFFPTTSPRQFDCSWIAVNKISTYNNIFGKTMIKFNNGNSLNLNISYNIIENQILRATKLDAILRKRKKLDENNFHKYDPNFIF